jgi:hypothetical protein
MPMHKPRCGIVAKLTQLSLSKVVTVAPFGTIELHSSVRHGVGSDRELKFS